MAERNEAKILIEESPLENLAAWVIKGFKSGNFFPLYASPRRDSDSQVIRGIHSVAPQFVKDRIEGAIALAINSWYEEEDHEGKVIHDLAFTAAMIRAAQSIGPLVSLVDQHRTDGQETSLAEALGTCVGVIAGFSETEEAFHALERWLFDDNFDKRRVATLANGVSSANPHNYPKYATRFFEIEKESPENFRTDNILAEMVRVVTIPIIAQHLHELEGYALEGFMHGLVADKYQMVELLDNPPGLRDRKSGEIFYFGSQKS